MPQINLMALKLGALKPSFSCSKGTKIGENFKAGTSR